MIRKTLTLAAAALVVLVLAVPAFAAPGPPGRNSVNSWEVENQSLRSWDLGPDSVGNSELKDSVLEPVFADIGELQDAVGALEEAVDNTTRLYVVTSDGGSQTQEFLSLEDPTPLDGEGTDVDESSAHVDVVVQH